MKYLLILAAALFVIALLHIAIPAVAKIILRRRFLNRIAQSRAICLTFDDGPDPRTTPRILDILKKHQANATFFVLGENAETHPHLLHRIAQEGHDIGEHGYRHQFAWTTCPLCSLEDIRRGKTCFQNLRLSRPPYGKLNLVTLLYALFARKTLAFWNLDPKDYSTPSAEAIAQTVLRGVRPGSVILLHDGRRIPHATAENTAEALEIILQDFRQRNITPTTISHALAMGNSSKT